MQMWKAVTAAALFTGATSLQAAAHEEHRAGESAPRPELSIGRSADYDYDPPAPGSYKLPPLKAASDGAVLDESGATRRLHELLAGRISVLAFVYTRCADPSGCPLTLTLLYELHGLSAEDPRLRENLQLVTLSFDPDYDTPEVMAMHAAAARNLQEGAPWHFLTTASQAALRPILKAYDQPVGRKTNPDDPLGPYTHQLRVYLIDRDMRIRNIYSLGFLDPRLVITDLRTLLLEEEPEG